MKRLFSKITVLLIFLFAAMTNVEAQPKPQQPQQQAPLIKAEVMPTFKGKKGDVEFKSYLTEALDDAPEMRGVKSPERATVTFVVKHDGSISSVAVTSSSSKALTTAVTRLTKASKGWKAGHNKGKAVDVKYSIAIEYRGGKSDHNPGGGESLGGGRL